MPKLGTLYRKYVRGSDLQGEIYAVKILDTYKVEVTPPPHFNPVEKWCFKVQGLPAELPDQILFGPKGEADLVQIFGRVEIADLKGKNIDLAPKTIKIAGKPQIAIVFRKSNGQPPQSPPPQPENELEDAEDVVQFTDDDDPPF